MPLRSYPRTTHKVDEVRAASSTGGVSIVDDAGTVGIFVEDSTGDVGIGTTSPTKRLEVAGGIKQSGGTVNLSSNGFASIMAAAHLTLDTTSNDHDVLLGCENNSADVKIGTAGSKAITVGSAAANTSIQGGPIALNSAGNLSLDSAATVNINTTSTTHATNVATEDRDGPVNIGTAGTRAITIGNDGDTAGTVAIRSEGGLTLDAGANAAAVTGDLTVSGSCTAASFEGDGSALTGVGAGDITAVSLTGDSGGALTVSTGAAGFSVLGGAGMTSSGTGTTITIAGDDAAADGSTKGVAAFNSSDFSASSGVISLADITTAHIASGSLDTDLSSVSGSDDTLASAKAIKAAIDAGGGGGAASFIMNQVFMVEIEDNTKLYIPPYQEGGWPFKYQVTLTGDIPAAGSTHNISGGAWYGPRYLAKWTAPVDCKLVEMGYSLNFGGPEYNSESLKIGVLKTTFPQGSDGSETSQTSDANWVCLGVATTYDMTGTPPAQNQKASESFTTDNTVDASDGVGVVFQGVAQSGGSSSTNVGKVYGVITLLFEAT